MIEKKYEEVGTIYRFFLSWRHAAFAGDLVILYGVIALTLSTYKDSPSLAWIIPLIACPIGFILWMIDYRTQSLYHAAIRAGKALESNGIGFFSELADKVVMPEGVSPFKKITHSGALTILFLGTSFGWRA